MLIKHYFKTFLANFSNSEFFYIQNFSDARKKIASEIIASSLIRNFSFSMTRKMKPYCKVRERQICNYKVNMYHMTVVALVLPSVINTKHRNSHFYKIRLCWLHRNLLLVECWRGSAVLNVSFWLCILVQYITAGMLRQNLNMEKS